MKQKRHKCQNTLQKIVLILATIFIRGRCVLYDCFTREVHFVCSYLPFTCVYSYCLYKLSILVAHQIPPLFYSLSIVSVFLMVDLAQDQDLDFGATQRSRIEPLFHPATFLAVFTIVITILDQKNFQTSTCR